MLRHFLFVTPEALTLSEYALQVRKEGQWIFLYLEVSNLAHSDIVRCPLKGKITLPFLVVRLSHNSLFLFKE
jgi:hypothetical protein